MEEYYSTFLEIVVAFILVLVNGLFVAAEFAMIRSQMTKLQNPEISEKWGVKSAIHLLQELDRSLSITQVGITLASLTLGWWGEHTFQRIIMAGTQAVGISVGVVTSHVIATGGALLIITYLHVVLGELVAKSIAIRFPEITLRILAGFIVVFTVLCRPLIFILNGSANLLLRLVRVNGAVDAQRVHSSAELALLIAHSTELGVLDKDEEQLLKGVFGFSETVAREVMTPRTDLVVIHYNATVDQVIQIAANTGLSRLPIIGDRIDDVLGVALVKDVLPYAANREKRFDIREIMREPYFVPGTKSISELLREFQTRKLHLAIVLDEHGGVDGVVTLEDLLEEIVGEIFDESDIPEMDVLEGPRGEFIVHGGVLVSDLNSRFSFALPEGDYDTIAGFIFTHLGRLPRPGEQLAVTDGDTVIITSSEIQKLMATAGVQFHGEETDRVGREELGEKRIKLLVTVERVRKRRIDSVRLKSFLTKEINQESASGLETSHLNEAGISQQDDASNQSERNISTK